MFVKTKNQENSNTMRGIILFLLILFTGILHSQNITLQIADESTRNPISFVSVMVNNQLFITNEEGQVVLPISENQIINIQHVSYKTKTINSDNLKHNTTIELELKDYTLPEVSIIPIDDKYCIKLLADIVDKCREETIPTNLNYAYYLEAKDVVYKEKIKALLKVNYAPSKGFHLPNNYLIAGDFWFMKENPFFNINTESFLLNYDPFAIKQPVANSYMYTNHRRIKSLKRYLFNISAVNDSLIKYVFNREGSDFLEEVIVNRRYNKIDLVYFKDKDIDAFTNINNTSNIAISNLELQYSYQNTEVIPSSITYNLEFTYGEASHQVRGFFKRDETPTANIQSLYLGPDLPPNIYQRILLNRGNLSYIDSVFSNYTYAGFELSETHGLQRKNLDITKNAMSVFENHEGLTVWNENGISDSEYNFKIVDNQLYREGNSLKVHQSKLGFIWTFNFEKIGGQWSANSYRTIMDNRNTVFYFRQTDALNSTYNVNLVFDFIELQRRKCLDSLMKIEGLSLKETKNFVQTCYKETISKATAICDKIVRNDFNLDNQLELNAEIYNHLGIDRFEALSEMLITDEETLKIFYNYMQTSYDWLNGKSNFQNIDAVTQYIRHSKKIISIILKNNSIANKYVGAMNISLAHAYLVLGDSKLACDCLREAKEYWPAGYSEAKKRVAFFNEKSIQNCFSKE